MKQLKLTKLTLKSLTSFFNMFLMFLIVLTKNMLHVYFNSEPDILWEAIDSVVREALHQSNLQKVDAIKESALLANRRKTNSDRYVQTDDAMVDYLLNEYRPRRALRTRRDL